MSSSTTSVSRELPLAVSFVVGCGRSGTTLLRAMLDAHSELAIPGESHFLTEVIENRRRYDGDGGFAAERFVADLLESERFLLWGLPLDDLQRAQPRPESRSTRRVLSVSSTPSTPNAVASSATGTRRPTTFFKYRSSRTCCPRPASST